MLSVAGNPSFNENNYPEVQILSSVQDPAQSWNAITVGAYTNLDQITAPELNEYSPVAPAGSISPFTTTSSLWHKQWPIKPEILMEGGNLAIDSSGFCSVCDDLSLVSTFYKPHESHFYPFSMTSASAAQASWFLAKNSIKVS